MRLGIHTLHISPREFWTCTLRELVVMRAHVGLKRSELDDLMQQWPDDGEGQNEH